MTARVQLLNRRLIVELSRDLPRPENSLGSIGSVRALAKRAANLFQWVVNRLNNLLEDFGSVERQQR
jgi:hypothetical protein